MSRGVEAGRPSDLPPGGGSIFGLSGEQGPQPSVPRTGVESPNTKNATAATPRPAVESPTQHHPPRGLRHIGLHRTDVQIHHNVTAPAPSGSAPERPFIHGDDVIGAAEERFAAEQEGRGYFERMAYNSTDSPLGGVTSVGIGPDGQPTRVASTSGGQERTEGLAEVGRKVDKVVSLVRRTARR